MLKPSLLVLAMASAVTLLSGCGEAKGDKKPEATDQKNEKIVVAPEDIVTMQAQNVNSGPVITGSIDPERRADLRAEVSAVVLQVIKENGDVVKKGDVLLRLDETSLRDNLNSANDATRNAALAVEQAERALQRLKTLRASGMTSLQALDDAELRKNAAVAELSAAKARAVQANQQLQRTVVRAPFDGVVSERKVSAGDTASPGKELLKVIDPESMRFVGQVSSEQVANVKVGQAVTFQVNGYSKQYFNGKVTRVEPSANAITRQVPVTVAFVEKDRPQVAGLFAEGHIATASNRAMVVPETMVVRSGDKSYVWKVAQNKLVKADLKLGNRDPRSGNYEVTQGLNVGDVVLRKPASNFKDGLAVQMTNQAPGKAVAQANAGGATAAPAAR